MCCGSELPQVTGEQDLGWLDAGCFVRAALANIDYRCSNHSVLPKDAQLRSVPSAGDFSLSLGRTFSASIGAAETPGTGLVGANSRGQMSAELTGGVTKMLQRADNSNNNT